MMPCLQRLIPILKHMVLPENLRDRVFWAKKVYPFLGNDIVTVIPLSFTGTDFILMPRNIYLSLPV